MAIDTDSAIEFFGTPVSLDSSSASVASAAFSIAGDLNDFTNTDDAPQASVVLEATFSVAPDVNSSVALFGRLDNIQGGNDQDDPSANYQHVFLGRFLVKNITSNQFIPIIISLPNNASSQIYRFFIQNNAGQAISAGWDIHITTKTIGPHA